MAYSLYIAGIEPGSGKSLVALGVMELLSRRIRQIGYFRPVIPSKEIADNTIQLIDTRYNLESTYEEMYAYVHDDAQMKVSKGSSEALLKEIFNKYKALESKCQFVLCEGTDFSGVSSAFEFDFNADVAANLGCPILVLVNGRHCHQRRRHDANVRHRAAYRHAFLLHRRIRQRPGGRQGARGRRHRP